MRRPGDAPWRRGEREKDERSNEPLLLRLLLLLLLLLTVVLTAVLPSASLSLLDGTAHVFLGDEARVGRVPDRERECSSPTASLSLLREDHALLPLDVSVSDLSVSSDVTLSVLSLLAPSAPLLRLPSVATSLQLSPPTTTATTAAASDAATPSTSA